MDAVLARLDALERRNTALSQENEAILARSSAQARHIARLERQLDALETDMGRVEGGWEESWVEDEGLSLAGVETGDGKSWRWRKPKSSSHGQRQPFDFSRLPTEVVREILRFSSPADLAVLCRVSFMMLEIAGPELYRYDIYLAGVEGLVKMFSRRSKAQRDNRLSDSLSARHVRHLTLYIPANEPFVDDAPDVSLLKTYPDRLSGGQPGPRFGQLRTLYLIFDHNTASIPRAYHPILLLLGRSVETVILNRRTTVGYNRLSGVLPPLTVQQLFPRLKALAQRGAYFIGGPLNEAEANAIAGDEDAAEHAQSSYRNIFILGLGTSSTSAVVEDLTVALLNSGSVTMTNEQMEPTTSHRTRQGRPEIWGGGVPGWVWPPQTEAKLADSLAQMAGDGDGGGPQTFRLLNSQDVQADGEVSRISDSLHVPSSKAQALLT